MNTRVIITAEDHASAGINSVKTSMVGLGAAVGAFSVLTQNAISAMGELVQQTVGLWKAQVGIADSMEEMSVRMGMSIKDMSMWKAAAEMNGTSLEAMSSGTRMLAKHMTEHGAALRKAGIDTKDTNKAFEQLSDLFHGMTDPVARVDLATRLFGRGLGQQLLPALVQGSAALKDIREVTDGYGEALTKLSPEAQKLNDSLYLIGVEFKRAAAEGVYPLVRDFNDLLLPALRDASKGTNGFNEPLQVLIETFRAIVVLGANVAFVFKAVGTEIGGMAAQLAALGRGDFKAFTAIGEMMKADAAQARKEFDALEAKLMSFGTKGGRSVAGLDVRDARDRRIDDAKHADEVAAKLQSDLRNKEKAEAAARVTEYERLTKSIREKTAALQASTESEDKATEAEKLALKLMVDIRDGTLKLTTTEKQKLALDLEALLTQDARATAHAKWLKQLEDEDKARAESLKATIAETVALEKKVAESEREVDEIGLTTEQLNFLKLARMDATIAAKEQELASVRLNSTSAAEIVLIEDQVEALRKLRDLEGMRQVRSAAADEAKRASKAWENFTRDLEGSLTDALMRSFESGDSFGEAFINNLKNLLKTAALKLTIQMAVNTGLGMVQNGLNGGNIFTGAGGATGSGALNLLSTGNSLYNLAAGGGALGGFGLGAASAASELALGASFVGPSASLAGGAIGAGASAGLATTSAGAASAMSGIAAAAPYVAAALAVASIFGDMFGSKKPAPIEWALLNRPENFDFKGAYSVWNQYSAESPFGEVTAIGQHLSRNGQSVASLKKTIADPIAALDKVLAEHMSTAEIAAAAKAVQYKSEVEHGFTQGEISGVMMQRLNRISNAIGGWVDTLFDTTAGKVESRYADLAQLLAIRGDEVLERLAQDMLTATGSFNGKKFTALTGGVAQYKSLFYSETEKFDDASAQVRRALGDLNVAFPESREGFRELVDGVDTSTKAGWDLYGSLIALSPAMDAYYKSLQDELAIKNQLAGRDKFATAVDYTRYQRIAGNFDATFAGDYAYNISRGAITPGGAANDGLVAEIRALRTEVQAGNVAIALAQQESARILRMWNGDGMPDVRVVA